MGGGIQGPPPDKYIDFNDAGMSTEQIAKKLWELYVTGATGPIATKFNQADGSTTYFIGAYTKRG
jgi:hypothetical protein